MEKKDFLTLCKYILVILAVPIVFKVVEILTSYQDLKLMIGIYVALFCLLVIVALIYVIKIIKLFIDI